MNQDRREEGPVRRARGRPRNTQVTVLVVHREARRIHESLRKAFARVQQEGCNDETKNNDEEDDAEDDDDDDDDDPVDEETDEDDGKSCAHSVVGGGGPRRQARRSLRAPDGQPRSVHRPRSAAEDGGGGAFHARSPTGVSYYCCYYR